MLLPVVGGRRGPRRARARAPRDPPRSPRSPEGDGVRTPRGAEPSGKSGAGWRWAPGSHPSAPSVPAASGPSRASPSLPFPRPRPRRARRVCVARCGVPCGVASLPLSPAAFPRSGSSGDPSLLGAGDPVLASRARDLSLGRGLWRNGGRSSPARRRTRRGPSPPEVLRRRRARLSRRCGVCASGERRGGPRAFRGTSRGKEA